MFFWFFKYFYVVYIILNIFLDIEFILLNLSLVFWHIFDGFFSIIKDYVHLDEVVILINFMIRFLLLNITLILIEFIF